MAAWSTPRGWTGASSSIVVAVAVTVVTPHTIVVPWPGWRGRGRRHTPSSTFSLFALPILLAAPQSVFLPLLGLPLLLLSLPLLPLLLPLALSFGPLDYPLPFVFLLLFAVKGLAFDVTWPSRSESSGHTVQLYLLCGGQTMGVMSLQ